MITASISIGWDNLSAYLEQQQACGGGWVLYHEPSCPDIELRLYSKTGIHTLTDWAKLPPQEGYLIAPFAIGIDTPIVFLEQTTETIYHKLPLPKDEGSISYSRKAELIPSEEYRSAFSTFSQELKAGKFDKLVLARSYDEPLSRPLDLSKIFVKACSIYPSAYSYLLYTPQTGLWLGCTPELLLATQKNRRFSTMALAGTQFVPEKLNTTLEWNEQFVREQAYVTDYIFQSLTPLTRELYVSPTYTIRAGQLAHLRSDITGRLYEPQSLVHVLEKLHPTPAVCGLPKSEALDFILKNEPINRRYYSGCLGLISPKGESRLYVNLRCMQIFASKARLYAGGGLLSGAILQDEWIETERKMQTISILLTEP